MIEFLVDNIYVRFGGQLFRQMVRIPLGTNCEPLLADLLFYSYENEFLDKLIKDSKRKLARKLNLSYRYTDDLISFNNTRFKEFISNIYPQKLTISETTASTSVASYLVLLFIRDKNNNITTKLYDKHDAFGFHIVNFPVMSSNMLSAPAYGIYASQLIHYACCCSNYSDLTSAMILTSTLSIFHSFPATYHLALLMVCTFHSSLDMHNTAHTMRISDIATSAWLIDFCHKAIEP